LLVPFILKALFSPPPKLLIFFMLAIPNKLPFLYYNNKRVDLLIA
jgi:hypothetical protein